MPGLRRLTQRNKPGPLKVEADLAWLDVLAGRAADVWPGGPERAQADVLSVAVVIPSFRRGSGGHATIANLVRGLEARGHVVELWLVDQQRRLEGRTEGEVEEAFRRFFGPVEAAVHVGLDGFPGADVVMATGWQTVAPALLLEGCRARAYLVQDHEPEFYGTSAERLLAERTYGLGLHCICASPWLAEVVTDRYGASATAFDLGVDHEHYRPQATMRRDDLVLFYARAVTPRRAVPLGILALAELRRRRPDVEVALFGEGRDVEVPFPALQLGVMAPEDLAHAYASATVGLCLSLTNPSLVPTEMLACGLPVVDVASEAMTSTFGPAGPVLLAEPDPLDLADAMERLLDDLPLRAELSRAGQELVAGRTWAAAAEQVEGGLRAALLAAE